METNVNLPSYRCHKVVQAARISDVRRSDTPGGMRAFILTVDLPSGGEAQIHVNPYYITRHDPEPGGYYVLYADGYESWSPAEAFEDGYTLMDPPLDDFEEEVPF